MSRFSDQVRDEFGREVPGVKVYVYEWDIPSQTTGVLSTLTDDDLTTPLSNPLATDEFGDFHFNTPNGAKLLEFHFGGKLQYREQILVGPQPTASQGGTVLNIDLFTNAGLFAIPFGVDTVQTSGYSVAGKGYGLYVYDAAVDAAYVIAHPRTSFVSAAIGADASRGFRLNDDQTITPAMLGTPADGATDDYPAFKAALDLLPSGGGIISVPAGTYKLLTQPNWAGKSIKWDISPAATFTGAGSVNFSGVPFTNSAFYSNNQNITNGAVPGSMFSGVQVSQNATEVRTSAIIVPSTATNHQTNAGGFYVRSDRAQVGNGGDVAGYHQAVSNATNAAVFALNAVMADTASFTGQKLNNEFDFNVNAADTTVTGINLVLVDNTGGLLSGARNPLRIAKAFGTSGWSNGLVTTDGALDSGGYAVFIGAVSTTTLTNRDSQPIAFVSYAADNTRYIATIRGDHTGGVALRPGLTTSAFAFQDPTGAANWAFVNNVGLNLPTGKVLTVNAVQVVGARDTGWSADTGTARKAANATYAAGTTLTYSAAYVQAEQTAMATRVAAIEAALQNIAQSQKAIKDALIAHGLIGA